MTETPKYSVIRKHKNIELRQYAGYIQAEVSVSEKDYKSAAYKGFNSLAGYIFGSNISNQKVEMTAPVQVSRSEKIAMTAPVTVTGDGDFTVAFIMPSAYSMESLPIPQDKNIHFVTVPTHRMAAIRFAGYFQQNIIEKHKRLLDEWLEQENLETECDYIVAGYDPPWIPWFLTRNEVMIKVIN